MRAKWIMQCWHQVCEVSVGSTVWASSKCFSAFGKGLKMVPSAERGATTGDRIADLESKNVSALRMLHWRITLRAIYGTLCIAAAYSGPQELVTEAMHCTAKIGVPNYETHCTYMCKQKNLLRPSLWYFFPVLEAVFQWIKEKFRSYMNYILNADTQQEWHFCSQVSGNVAESWKLRCISHDEGWHTVQFSLVRPETKCRLFLGHPIQECTY